MLFLIFRVWFLVEFNSLQKRNSKAFLPIYKAAFLRNSVSCFAVCYTTDVWCWSASCVALCGTLICAFEWQAVQRNQVTKMDKMFTALVFACLWLLPVKTTSNYHCPAHLQSMLKAALLSLEILSFTFRQIFSSSPLCHTKAPFIDLIDIALLTNSTSDFVCFHLQCCSYTNVVSVDSCLDDRGIIYANLWCILLKLSVILWSLYREFNIRHRNLQGTFVIVLSQILVQVSDSVLRAAS